MDDDDRGATVMPNLSLIIGLMTTIASFMGLLLAVNINSRKMRVMGRGMLAGSAGGGLCLGLVVEWGVAALALGLGLVSAVILLYFFLDGGSL